MHTSHEPRLRAKRFTITVPHWQYQKGDVVEVYKGFPEPGQHVLVDLQQGKTIGIYRKNHIELPNGTRVIGQMKRIIGVVVLIGKVLYSIAPLYLS